MPFVVLNGVLHTSDNITNALPETLNDMADEAAIANYQEAVRLLVRQLGPAEAIPEMEAALLAVELGHTEGEKHE